MECGSCQETCGIERGKGRVCVAEDEGNLGAAEDNCLTTLMLHARNDLLEGGDGFWFENAVDELVHNDAIDSFALCEVGSHALDVAGGEIVGVYIAFDQPAGSGERDALEATRCGVGGNDFGDVQPGERRTLGDERKRLMDGVIGADEEVCSDGCELIGRGEHQIADAGPVIAIDLLHVLGK